LIRRWTGLAGCWCALELLAAKPTVLAQAEPDPAPSGSPASDLGPAPDELAASSAGPTDEEVAAQLAALNAAPNDESLDLEQPNLRFYGFADALVQKAYTKTRLGAFPPKGISFFVGNINLYAAADLTHGFSSLLEVRFSYLPNGTFDTGTLATTSTNVLDYADWNRSNRWGGIVLERVHLDYEVHPLLAFRVGQWLTPYGVWNVDHGSPTVIPVNKPYVVGEQLIPTRQSGFQAYGSYLFGNVTLAYNATVSNGRGDVDQFDLDDNKAAGGHISLATSEFGSFRLGLSAYGGQSSKSSKLSSQPGNPPSFTLGSTDRYKERAFGADLVWEWSGLRIQSEGLVSQIKYDDPARKLATGFGSISGFVPDRVAWGAYVLVAYRIPKIELMPYFVFDTFDRGYARHELLVFGGNTVNVRAVSGGLNYRPVPSVVLKAQYSSIMFPGTEFDADLHNLSFQFAWAF
jgi:hypothetical protein